MNLNNYETTSEKARLYSKCQMGDQEQRHQMRACTSLMNTFFVCLLASFVTITLGVSLVLFTPSLKLPNKEKLEESSKLLSSNPPVDPKFKYLNRMEKSKFDADPHSHHTLTQKFVSSGGVVQWARYRKNPKDYDTKEEEEFGSSINANEAKMTASTLLIKPNGCRVPHWHFNANEHGFLATGTVWIGILDSAPFSVTSYNVTAGQVIFLPRSTLHWMKCVGQEDCLFVLFFTTHEEVVTRDVDDVFYATPQDIAARSLKPVGGVDFIRSFKQPAENQAVNLPPNLNELVRKASYTQSRDFLVARYFYDLKASKQYRYPGGIIQWARYTKDQTGLSRNEIIFAKSLNEHEDTVTIATMRIFTNGMRQPHYHFNANEMGYVLSGCGKVGVVSRDVVNFDIEKGDVFFFPHGTHHYIKSTCDEDLVLVIGYSTGNELQTLDMNIYFQSTADFILAQLFLKKQDEFQKIPTFKDPQDINLP